MTEKNAERIKRIKRQIATVTGLYTTKYGDIHFLIEQAERVPELENDIEVMSMTAGDSANDLVKSQDKYKRLVKDYNELFIQENAMQNNWKLAFFSAEKYKKCLDDITVAMNTERPAEEKTKDVRRILEGSK